MTESPLTPSTYQEQVYDWGVACFGLPDAIDPVMRPHRFLEEALELVQACGCTEEAAQQLVAYVYGRPVGEPFQEVGGTMISLAMLCQTIGVDMTVAGETELARVLQNIEKIRVRHQAKPKFGGPVGGMSLDETRLLAAMYEVRPPLEKTGAPYDAVRAALNRLWIAYETLKNLEQAPLDKPNPLR